jgi:hypothetical protein
VTKALKESPPRLIINPTPQEGKSEQVSRRFPAYARKLSLGAQMI